MLVVCRDHAGREGLQLALLALGHRSEATADLVTAERELSESDYDCVLCDHGAVDRVLAVLASNEARMAPTVVSLGESLAAYDWLPTPVHPHTLSRVLARVVERRDMMGENEALRRRLRPPSAPPDLQGELPGIVGASPAMQSVIHQVRKVAQYKTSVLITGESGTGKELAARAIHALSPRSTAPFVAINCGAIPPQLLESELFGHCRGAFTDAVRDKRGMFTEANGGTLFLDEIGELPLELQVKLLRALQEEEVRPIGDNRPTHVDVRVIAATVRDLEADVAAGRFREDLYYRLNVVPLRLPGLRERVEDIPSLVEHFIARYCRKHALARLAVRTVSEEALQRLLAYDWPGNIRELENTVERAMVLCEGEVIGAELLEERILRGARAAVGAAQPGGELSIKKATRALERQLIAKALAETQGNRTNAAKLLEISHRALLYKIKDYGL